MESRKILTCVNVCQGHWVGSGVVWQHDVQQAWKAGWGDTGPLCTHIELNSYKFTVKPWSSVSESWKAEVGNPACSDPFQIVSLSSRREMGTRELQVSSYANEYLWTCSTPAVVSCALGRTWALGGRNLAFPGIKGRYEWPDHCICVRPCEVEDS